MQTKKTMVTYHFNEKTYDYLIESLNRCQRSIEAILYNERCNKIRMKRMDSITREDLESLVRYIESRKANALKLTNKDV